MMMYSIGSMIACQVVIGDTLPWCLHTLFKVNMNVFTREAVMIVVAVLLVLPLCLLKNVSTLSSASLLSVVAVLLLVLIVVVHGPSEMNRQGLTYEIATDTTIVSPNVLSGIATISFHYVCQQSCFLMFRSLEQPTLVNWKKVSHFSIGFTMTMTLLLSICGYVYFTDSVDGNVLNNFAELDGVITVARLFMAVNMVLTIPMECFIVRHAVFSICNRYYPLKELPLPVDSSSHMNSSSASNTSWGNASYSEQAIEERSDGRSWEAVGTRGMGEDLEILPDNDETEWNSIAHILVTIALWSSTLGFALLFQDLSVVLAFSGILAASMLGFVLPAMIILKTYMVPIKHMLQMRGFIAIASLPSSALDMDSAWREIRLKDAGDVSTQGDASSSQNLMANFLFSAFLGIFGLFILVMGLVMEIYHLSRGEEYVDPTTNY
ncbi:SLC38A11 [Symbiodinium microadriaticum]|nr:SLC38A11 [Symbiodinium microadriaticum]